MLLLQIKILLVVMLNLIGNCFLNETKKKEEESNFVYL